MAQKHRQKRGPAEQATTAAKVDAGTQAGGALELHDAVSAAVVAGDLVAALKQLALVRLRTPNDPFGYTEAASLLQRLDRPDDAETLLAGGMKRAQTAAEVAPAYAQSAMLRALWPEAARRWARARTLRPTDPACLSGNIAAALLAGTDAAALIAQAHADPAWPAIRAGVEQAVEPMPEILAKWREQPAGPADPTPQVDIGALRRQGYAAAPDWAAADIAWQALRDAAPLLPEGWTHGAAALRRLGRPTEAAALLQQGLLQLPAHLHLLIGLGYNASETDDWAAALPAWANVRGAAPDTADGWVHAATALERLGRGDDAETLMAEALQHLPADRGVLARLAYLAVHRGDWTKALERWQTMDATFPNDAEILAGIARAQNHLPK